MNNATLEHVNVTVSDPEKTANMLCDLFGWSIRWHGPSKLDGYTYHVGTPNDYLAIYSYGKTVDSGVSSYQTKGGLNHIGIVVDDLDQAERRIKAAGYKTHSHGDYEPGRRFYFHDDDGIEFEVISYRSDQEAL